MVKFWRTELKTRFRPANGFPDLGNMSLVLQEMRSTGQGASYAGNKKSALRIWELMRKSSPELSQKYPKPWDEMSEEEVCCREPYGLYFNQ